MTDSLRPSQSTWIIQSTYWLTVFPLRGSSAIFDLAQVVSLLIVWGRTKLFGRTPREIREVCKSPPVINSHFADKICSNSGRLLLNLIMLSTSPTTFLWSLLDSFIVLLLLSFLSSPLSPLPFLPGYTSTNSCMFALPKSKQAEDSGESSSIGSWRLL